MAILQHRIFLSHSSEDHDFCIRLINDLRQILGDNDAVWYDKRGGLYGGDDWWPRIEQEMQTRNVFIVVLSPNSVASAWVNDEIDIALRRKNLPDSARRMRIIPVLYHPCEIRPGFENHQIISFLPPKPYEVAFQEILNELGLPSALTAMPKAIEVLRTLKGHTGVVRSVVLSTDGLTLASGSSDHTIKLWNARTGQLLRTLTGHTNPVYSVAWSADGQTLASGSGDRTIRLWNVQTGQVIRTFTGHTSPVYSVAWSADGQTLASGSGDRTITLWNAQTSQDTCTLKGHTSYVQCVAWSPDGRMLASGSSDHTIKLWNVQTGQLRHTFTGHKDTVHSVAWSADGLTLASGSRDYTVRVWNAQTGQLRQTFAGHKDTVHYVAWSADGQMLASGSDNKTIKLWNVRTGQFLCNLSSHTGSVYSVVLSADGLMLASGSSDHTINIWGVKEQNMPAPHPDPDPARLPHPLTDHTDAIASVATLASSNGNHTIKVEGAQFMPATIFFCYAREDQALLNQLKTHLLPLQRQGIIEFWYDREVHAETDWEPEIKKKLDTARIILLLVSPDFMDSDYYYSKEMKQALERHQRGEARVIPIILRPVYWDEELLGKLQALPTDGKPVTNSDWRIQDKALYHVTNGISNVVAQLSAPPASSGMVPTATLRPAPQNRPAAISGDLQVTAPPLTETIEALHTLNGHTSDIYSVAFSVDGLTLASVSGSKDPTIKLWNAQTGQLLRTLEGHTGHKGTITGVAWSANGQMLASGSYDKTIKLWNTQTGQATLILKGDNGHKDAITSVAWSVDGLMLASGSIDGTIKLWNAQTGQLLRTLEGHTNYVGSVAWSANGQMLASGSIDGTIKLWHIHTGHLTLTGHKDALWSVAWSADGQMLASGSADRTIKLWNIQTGQLLRTLTGHTGVITSVAWSADGQTLASSSADQTVKLWNIQTGQLLRTLTGHTNTVYRVAWSADGQMLASGGADKTVKLWGVKQ
jgi:WD40 repeat protein